MRKHKYKIQNKFSKNIYNIVTKLYLKAKNMRRANKQAYLELTYTNH